MGRQRTAAAAARGGSAGDERAVSGGVPTDHWEDLGDCVTVRFAPEGWPFIIPGWALVFLGAWVAQGSPWLWVPEVALVLLAVWLLVFFRDPVRMGPRGEQFVIAPADGKVVDIAVVEEPTYLAAQATRISIFMSVFDVHVNRYPATGAVELVRYHRGKFLHAASDKASLDNEQSSVGLRSVGGPVLVRQIAGLIARRIVTDGKPGDRVHQGERLGMIRFGSRVDVFLPLAARAAVRVAVGERVRAGATLLAEYGP
ncbi:MAG: phosphatidylserine decarboxylase family protein [Gemmatimonadetes bacterium]|nr:MAG: phosphatidylserine decarboxylase family protein [Gemmatimonadota bacterium]